MSHRNAPLSFEGRLRLVQRCQQRPISHVAAEMGISRACASKWVNRWRRHGELGLHDRPSTPHHSPDATPAWVIERIETWRREKKWSANRITHELAELDFRINRRTVTRHLTRLGLGQRRFIDPSGHSNRKPGKIIARWPGHMAHLDVKKVGRISDGGGWRIHGRNCAQKRAVDRAKTAGAKAGYLYLHSIVDGFSRLAYTEPLDDEKGTTAAAFLARAKVWFAAHSITHIHRIVTDNGACYRSNDFARIVGHRTRHQKTKPYTPRHNGKAERYQRIMTEELLYAREYASEDERSQAIAIWNVHYNYHRPHLAAGGPEGKGPGAQPFGETAYLFSRITLRENEAVLEFDRLRTDHRGGLLAYVYLPDGAMLNEVLLREGYARVALSPPNLRYDGLLPAAQYEARRKGRGL